MSFDRKHIQIRLIRVLVYLRALSAHRLSISLYLFASVLLFCTILFVALPSARIRVWPSVSPVSHTSNVLLMLSGATIDPGRRHTLPLHPINTTVRRTLTFDQISTHFMGDNARTEMTIINETDEPYILRKGTRLVNQAGMIFRLQESVTVPPAAIVESGVARTEAIASPKDLYGQIVGERGNVPAGLKWEFPGLSLEERKEVYARNTSPATGGTTAHGLRLQEEDLELAKKQLEQELVQTATAFVEEEVARISHQDDSEYVILQYDVLTEMEFLDFSLPHDRIGQSVQSVPVEGSLQYRVLAYNKHDLLEILVPGLESHIERGYRLVPGSIMKDGISVHVIEYDDDLQWVKITAELTGKQHAELSPITATGREFGQRLREMVRGKTVHDAERIIQNFPEVGRVDVSVWPPWRTTIPSLTSNITLTAEH